MWNLVHHISCGFPTMRTISGDGMCDGIMCASHGVVTVQASRITDGDELCDGFYICVPHVLEMVGEKRHILVTI